MIGYQFYFKLNREIELEYMKALEVLVNSRFAALQLQLDINKKYRRLYQLDERVHTIICDLTSNKEGHIVLFSEQDLPDEEIVHIAEDVLPSILSHEGIIGSWLSCEFVLECDSLVDDISNEYFDNPGYTVELNSEELNEFLTHLYFRLAPIFSVPIEYELEEQDCLIDVSSIDYVGEIELQSCTKELQSFLN